MWKLKYDTNEPMKQADSETSETDFWLPKGKGGMEG